MAVAPGLDHTALKHIWHLLYHGHLYAFARVILMTLILIPTLQMRKPRPRELSQLVEDHKLRNIRADVNPVSLWVTVTFWHKGLCVVFPKLG